MIRKFIFLIISLFLFVPASYADDSSIVPAYQLFLKNNCLKNIDINSIKEYDGPNTNVFQAKTYLLNGNSIKEYDGPNTNVFPAKTYLLNGNSIKEYDGPNTNVFPAKTYLLSF